FQCTDAGDLSSCIGLKIQRDQAARLVTISQKSYLESVLQWFDFPLVILFLH
ncbi:hypothetical protein C7212DRAFT_203972, partial [Tuber magnatum]